MIRGLTGALLMAIALAACGGSTSASRSTHLISSSATSRSSSAATTPATTPAAIQSTTSSSTTSVTLTQTTTSARPPEVPRSQKIRRHPVQTSSDVHLASTLTVGGGGALSPPTLAIPARVALTLTIHDRDSRAHRIAVRSGHVTVAPGASATLVLRGLPKGAYPLTVDGAARGELTVGVNPGP